ncbi:MAG: hypothetical protein QM765_44530 [Myxococcales bacterium]
MAARRIWSTRSVRARAGRRGLGSSFSIGNITTAALKGVKFVRPEYTVSTKGITDMMFLDDVDNDNRAEIVFGMSDIHYVVEDQQDYDPLDTPDMHDNDPPPTWPKGEYYYWAPGWRLYSSQGDGTPWDWLILAPAASSFLALGPGRLGLQPEQYRQWHRVDR